MKKLIKTMLLLTILSIFAFSNNKVISKIRNFTMDKGKVLYEKTINNLKNSGGTSEKVANFID